MEPTFTFEAGPGLELTLGSGLALASVLVMFYLVYLLRKELR